MTSIMYIVMTLTFTLQYFLVNLVKDINLNLVVGISLGVCVVVMLLEVFEIGNKIDTKSLNLQEIEFNILKSCL